LDEREKKQQQRDRLLFVLPNKKIEERAEERATILLISCFLIDFMRCRTAAQSNILILFQKNHSFINRNGNSCHCSRRTHNSERLINQSIVLFVEKMT
jgi:hypothetical protein